MPAASINNIIGTRFIELLSVDSTNNYAMQQVKKGIAQHGDVFFAYRQTSGKGQFQKQWLSADGENIILSVVIETNNLELQKQFLLNMAAALSVLQLFNNYTTEKIKIKWPNDIYWNDRKAAGILIENIVQGKKWQYAVAGFGININQTVFDESLKNPVSLKQVTGKSYNPVDLAKEFCTVVDKNLEQIFSGNECFIFNNYNDALFKRNEMVKFKQGNNVFSGKVKSVDKLGRLHIENSTDHIFESGSIEWLL